MPLNPQAPLDDLRWLLSDEAAGWLRQAAEDAQPTVRLAQRLRRELSAARTHLILEQVELRRRAAAKFPQAERMYFTPTGLEQATDHWVAAYKATRFAPGEAVADLCCGIGGDLMALAARGPALGVDRDPWTALVAEANLRVLLPQGCHCWLAQQCDPPRGPALPDKPAVAPLFSAAVQCLDVAAIDLHEYTAWHIDPDRRPQGRRTTRVELHEPDATTLQTMLAQRPNAAIKLAPAATLPEAWPHEAELEWISRQRQCRQLVAWFGRLAQHPGQHRATIVEDGDAQNPPHVHTIVGTPSESFPVAPRIGCYVFDPDPAVLAARLTAAVAAEHNLAAVAESIPYLTGDQPLTTPALACFEVTDILPFDRKRLKSLLDARGIGRLEIKKRGIADDPEQLRRQLHLRGDQAAVLLLAPIAGTVTAVLARRL